MEGEKCSKFFLNLEKQQKSKQNLNKLKISNSQVTTDPEIILKEVRSFYKTLYSKQKPNERAINHIFVGTNKTISQKSKTQCEDTLTEENLRKALFDMESNKSPGTDGLTAEFYKHFWDLIGPHLLKVIHSCLQNKQLTHSQQEAVISCLYKKGPREQISNWRPISLLNIDYKILTKSLANKLISTLSEVISEDQTASVTGRSILTNLNLTRDIIQYAWDKKIPASLISIDQVKAFDRVDWDFLFHVLKKFGYGQQFITNIKTIYTNIQSKIKINGCMSEPFFLERGVRQGCPLSMPLYVLCAEILANYIRTRTQIKGVQINRHECKLTQFADDTNLFLVGQKSIDHLEDALQLYEEASGAQINIDKCEGMWLGSYIDNTSKPLGYKWRNDKIKVLGVHFCNPGFYVDNENWDSELEKILSTIHLWKNLKLSYKGKRIVINQLFLSRIWYAAQVIPIPTHIIKALESEIYKFLWDGRMHTVNKLTTQLAISEGGLGIINIKLQTQALQLNWVSKLLNPEIKHIWKEFFEHHLNKLHKSPQGKYSLFTFVSNVDFRNSRGIPIFYKQLIDSWLNLNDNNRKPPTTVEGILNEPLFHNYFIRKPPTAEEPWPKLWKTPNWATDKIVTIADLCHVFIPGFVSHEMACKIAEVQIPLKDFQLLLCSIPQDWKKIVNSETQTFNHLNYPYMTMTSDNKQLPIHKFTTKLFYQKLLQLNTRQVDPKYRRWETEGGLNMTPKKWSKAFHSLHSSQTNNKIYNIQWKLLHLSLPTRETLKNINTVKENQCQRCNVASESHLHWFYSCPDTAKVRHFLILLLNKLYPKLSPILDSPALILFGMEHCGYSNTPIGRICVEEFISSIYYCRNKVLFDNESIDSLIFFKGKLRIKIFYEYCVAKATGKLADFLTNCKICDAQGNVSLTV